MVKFGTGGFRGVIGDDFTRENVTLVAQGISDIIVGHNLQRKVVVGYDYRFGSDYFAEWIAETFAGNGIKCMLYTEAMPTPAVMTAVRDEGLDYGVMITASHNPYRFNGVKVFVKGGMDADVAFTDLLESTVAACKEVKRLDGNAARKCGLIENYSNKEQYLDNIYSFISPQIRNSDIKILYDNLNGVGATCIEPMFKKAGIKNYNILHKKHDAFFNFLPPCPSPNAMEQLKNEVKKGYAFAMATDSDSDRLGILDENGEYLSANHILACLYYYLIKYRGMSGDIVKSCATSVLIDKVAERAGFKCHEVDVGFKNISSEMKRVNALLGGESSGGLTMRGYIYGKDSVFSSILFTEMVVVMGKPVSEIVREVCRFAGYSATVLEDEIRFDDEGVTVPDGVPEFTEAPLRCERFGANIKYYFEKDCWALIRKSGTEPVVRIFAEFDSAERAERNLAALRAFMCGDKVTRSA